MKKLNSKLKKLALALFLLCNILLAGCINVQMAPHNSDVAAKKFVTDPVKANIYITRTRKWWIADNFAMQALIDGRVVGSLAPNTFVMFSVLPGKHTVAISIEGNVVQQRVDLNWGTNYFFEVKPFVGHFELGLVPEEQGRQEVIKSKRAEGAVSIYD